MPTPPGCYSVGLLPLELTARPTDPGRLLAASHALPHEARRNMSAAAASAKAASSLSAAMRRDEPRLETRSGRHRSSAGAHQAADGHEHAAAMHSRRRGGI